MEKERRKLDKQLDLVQEKTKRAYLSQEILEAKMKVNSRSLSKLYVFPNVFPQWNSLCHKYWWSGVNIIDRHSDTELQFNVIERILKINTALTWIWYLGELDYIKELTNQAKNITWLQLCLSILRLTNTRHDKP